MLSEKRKYKSVSALKQSCVHNQRQKLVKMLLVTDDFAFLIYYHGTDSEQTI